MILSDISTGPGQLTAEVMHAYTGIIVGGIKPKELIVIGKSELKVKTIQILTAYFTRIQGNFSLIP